MKVGKVCKTIQSAAMPGWSTEDDGGSKRTGEAGAEEMEVRKVSSGKTYGDGALTEAAKILYAYAVCGTLYPGFLEQSNYFLYHSWQRVEEDTKGREISLEAFIEFEVLKTRTRRVDETLEKKSTKDSTLKGEIAVSNNRCKQHL